MANACVFCGTTTEKITKEHVFPDWISELFGREPGGTAEMVESDGSIQAFPTVPFQQQVRVVCKPCNEGWMADLESDVKGFLGVRKTLEALVSRSEQAPKRTLAPVPVDAEAAARRIRAAERAVETASDVEDADRAEVLCLLHQARARLGAGS
jgi:hypothetical protein